VDLACIQETRLRGSGCRFFGAQGKRYMEYEVEGSRPREVDQRGHGKRLCKKNCQARNLNKEDAMDRGRKKLIKIG